MPSEGSQEGVGVDQARGQGLWEVSPKKAMSSDFQSCTLNSYPSPTPLCIPHLGILLTRSCGGHSPSFSTKGTATGTWPRVLLQQLTRHSFCERVATKSTYSEKLRFQRDKGRNTQCHEDSEGLAGLSSCALQSSHLSRKQVLLTNDNPMS